MKSPRKPFLLTGSKNQLVVTALLSLTVLFLAIFMNAGGSRAAAQTAQAAITGEWMATLSTRSPGKVHFTFARHGENNSYNMSSDGDMMLSEFQGLPADIQSAAKTQVNFTIAREAGTFQCEGYFNQGSGSGIWTLTPNEKFISAMRDRGFTDLSEENLISAAVHDITARFADEIKNAGYDHLSFDDLRRAKTHNLTAAYIKELRAAGYNDLSFDDVVRASNHSIDAQYIKQVRDMGFDTKSMDEVIRLRNHDITPEYLAEMKSTGLENLTLDDLLRLQSHSVTPAFVNDIKAEGYAAVSADIIIRLRSHDIDRDFIRRAKAQGYNVSLDEMIRLKNRDVVK